MQLVALILVIVFSYILGIFVGYQLARRGN
jgi:hypothetical protein